MFKFSRRAAIRALAAGALAGLGGCGSTDQRAHATSARRVFRHGVASGDPRSDSVVLWTRVDGQGESAAVRWRVARDPDFKRIIASGRGSALAENDYTFKVIASDLEPGATYFYEFVALGERSPIGRTRTLPVGRLDRLGIALASCSSYPFGFFNAYDAIAKDASVDVVLHTGDYIYEYGVDGFGGETGRRIGRMHEPAHEIVSLADYRARHAQYKRDAGSLAMHAAHPLITLWDDHESANNPWTGGAENHQPETEGDWLIRRTNAVRAYYEWMPIREPEAGRTREEFWRTYNFGDLATLVTVESRHTARGEQVDYKHYAPLLKTEADFAAFKRDVIGAPDRKMISPAMESELRASLGASISAGRPWRLIGNAIPMARNLVPDVVAMGVLPDPEGRSDLPEAARRLALLGRNNLPFYTDTWDGYPVAREAFYSLCRETGARDLLVLTGDSHSFWMNRLADEAGNRMGLELGTAGITSPGDFVDSGFSPALAEQLDRAFERGMDEVVWTDNLHQGYVRVDLRREDAVATFVTVDNVLTPTYRPSVLRSTRIVRSGGTIDYGDV